MVKTNYLPIIVTWPFCPSKAATLATFTMQPVIGTVRLQLARLRLQHFFVVRVEVGVEVEVKIEVRFRIWVRVRVRVQVRMRVGLR